VPFFIFHLSVSNAHLMASRNPLKNLLSALVSLYGALLCSWCAYHAFVSGAFRGTRFHVSFSDHPIAFLAFQLAAIGLGLFLLMAVLGFVHAVFAGTVDDAAS
jgi:hypothetical protein